MCCFRLLLFIVLLDSHFLSLSLALSLSLSVSISLTRGCVFSHEPARGVMLDSCMFIISYLSIKKHFPPIYVDVWLCFRALLPLKTHRHTHIYGEISLSLSLFLVASIYQLCLFFIIVQCKWCFALLLLLVLSMVMFLLLLLLTPIYQSDCT